jgi:outer membrane receptor protein involved in Fe transport
MFHAKSLGFMLVLSLVFSPTLFAQVNTGTILGTVSDPSGAAIANAKITATNEDTAFARRTQSLADGSYLIPLLPIGPKYNVVVEAPGFKSFSQSGIELLLNQNVRIDVRVQVGVTTESVQVNEQAPLVDTQSAVGGEVVESRRMTELPLNGRNPLQLAGLVPGVSALGTVPVITLGNRAANFMSIDGSRINETDYQLNGVRFAGSYNNSGLNYPDPDALSEFKLITNPLSAEYGEYSGAVFSAVTKSGTNSFHGSVYEFLRNDKLNARNYFSTTVPALKQNQFGATAGGRIIKDRLFWFGSYQGFRIRQEALQPSFPLTADERNGLITSATPVLDPSTGLAFPTDSQGRFVIPQDRINPVTQVLLSKYLPTSPPSGVFQETGSSKVDVSQYSGKIDYNIKMSDQLYFSALADETDPSNPFTACCPSTGESFTGYGSINQTQKVKVFTVSEIHTLRPNIINEFRFGFSKQEELNKGVNQVSPDSLGINNWNFNFDPDKNPQSPTFIVPGRFQLGALGFGKWREGGRNFQFTDIVSMVKGKHNIRAGIDLYHREHHLDANVGDTGFFIFGGSFTGGNPTAEFLLGKPDTELRIRYLNHPGYRAWSQGFFFQDDWKISRRLTLNLGARYELLNPFSEYRAQNESNTVWNPRGPLPISGGGTYLPGGQQSTVLPLAPPGLLFPGDKTANFPSGIPNALIGLDKSLIEPRIGLAWDPMGDGKTSVRASVGLFSNAQFVDLPAQVSQNLPFLVVQGIFQPSHDLTDPYQGQLTFPPISSNNLTTDPNFFTPFLPTAGYGWNPNYRQPRITTMTFNIQREIVKNLTAEVGYVGKLSRHLATTSDINTAQKNIPGLVPSVANEPQRRMLDGVNFQKIDYEQSNMNASYNALQATIRYRAAKSLTLLTAYTWSHSIDLYSTIGVQCACFQNPLDPGADRGSSDFDQRHVFALSAVYALPDPFKSMNSHAMSLVLGGWELSGIMSAQTGVPFTVFTGTDASLTGAGADRPDLIGNPFFSGGRSRAQQVAGYINPAAFQINDGHFGSLGRNTFTNPGLLNFDLGFFKNIPVTERMKLQFRVELFNAFNHTHLGSPVNTFVSPAFGQIVSAGDPRLIQFALKFSW